MRPYLLLALLIFTLESFSQSYSTLEFINYTPIWSRISTTNNLPLNVQNYELVQGFGNAPLVVQNEIMYNVYNIFNNFYDGYYIEAVNLKDGKLIWDDSYEGVKKNTCKIGLLPDVSNSVLQLPILAENDPPDFNLWPLWVYAKAEKNTYDITTGIKIDSTSNLKQDTTAKILGNYYGLFQNNNRDRLYSFGNNYKYIINLSLLNSVTLESYLQYDSYTLSLSGLIIDSTRLIINTKYPVSTCNLIDLEDQTIFSFSLCESGSDSTYLNQPLYQIFTRELALMEEGDLSGLLPKNKSYKYAISYTNKSNFNIVTYVQNSSNSINYKYLTTFDRKGKLIESIDLTALNLIVDQQTTHGIQSTVIYENNIIKTLFCVSAFENNSYKFTFYKTNGNGNFKEVKSLIPIVEEKENINLRRIYKIGNNVLCLFDYKEGKTRTSPIPRWPCWVMISGDDLEVGTKNEHSNFIDDSFTLLTTIASNKLILNFGSNQFEKLSIFDNNGKCILSTIEIKKEIDISNLSTGVYYVKIDYGKGHSKTNKFIKN